MSTTVAIVDGEEVVRLGLVAALQNRPDVTAYAYSSPSEATDGPYDLVILGTCGRTTGLLSTMVATLTADGSMVIVHTCDERAVPLRAAIGAGASGIALRRDGLAGLRTVVRTARTGVIAYSSESARELCESTSSVARLSHRESQVLEALSDGLTHRQIARLLGVEEETVKTHLKSIRSKYVALGRNITNAMSLNREAHADGWLD